MNAPKTQKKSEIPMSETDRKASGSVQWYLEQEQDAATPVFRFNNLSVYICGEESFARIAEDIRNATASIDIACWGFDPAMELTRKAGPWPRGDTWGDLLRDAASGRFNGGRKVEVRLLAWWDQMAARAQGSNMPGYKQVADFDRRTAFQEGMGAARSTSGSHFKHPEPATPRDRRQAFNSHWFRDIAAGKIDGLSLRTRGGVNAEVMASLKAEGHRLDDPGLGGLDRIERSLLERFATHHQKTIVIDYEGADPRAYVMGLNSVTDYWDTTAHLFNDPRRGELYEGGGTDHSAGTGWNDPTADKTSLKPYQDYVCRIQGEAVAAVCKNFTEAWNKARVEKPGGGVDLSRSFDLKKPPAHLKAGLDHTMQSAQILRTLPGAEGGEQSIARLYHQASSFARHYLYIENQYFQNTAWAHALKEARRTYVAGLAAALPPVPLAQVPVLHVMVVTPTPERAQMVPRTHDMLAELAQADSAPNHDRLINDELERHRRGKQAWSEYDAQREAREAGRSSAPMPHPPPAVAPLSELALNHEKAGATRNSQAAREVLEGTLGLLTLVASLWTYDREWSLADTPVARKVAQERRDHERRLKDWEQRRSFGGLAGSGAPRPEPPPDRSKEIRDAMARRYREIYIHSKLMIIDDSMFTLGSANLNLRSFAVDSEINIASDDAALAKDLRQRVWGLHTEGKFEGGKDATEERAIKETFKAWSREAQKNLNQLKKGEPLSCFLVKFYEERTSYYRFA